MISGGRTDIATNTALMEMKTPISRGFFGKKVFNKEVEAHSQMFSIEPVGVSLHLRHQSQVDEGII